MKCNKLAIGTAQFGMPYGVANQNGQVRVDEIQAILDLAWENDVDTLDTAKSYGSSEKLIGDYIKHRPANSWNIITKLSEHEINVADQIKNSTEKMNISPSIVLAHSAEIFLDEDFQKELSDSRNRKIISKVGVSLYNQNEISRVMQSSMEPEVIQFPMNILDTRLYRSGVLTKLHKKNVEIHVRSVFLQGLFYLSESQLNDSFGDAVPYLDKLKLIASKSGLTLAELSLLWLVNLEEVTKIIIGVDNAEQLQDHLNALDKNVDPAIFNNALSVIYENEQVLNPSLWP